MSIHGQDICVWWSEKPHVHNLEARKDLGLRLRDTVCSWRSTAHAHGRFSMDFELTPLVISSIFFFWTKNSVQCLWIWRDLVTNVLYDGQCRAWQSHFKNIVGGCNFTEARSCEVCTVLLDRRLFLKNQTTLPKNRSVRPSSRLKTVDLDYCLSLSVARLVRFWFKSLQKVWPPTTDSSYKVTYFFWLCVRMRCLSICAPSFVALVWCKWAVRVIAFWAAEHAPNCIP